MNVEMEMNKVMRYARNTPNAAEREFWYEFTVRCICEFVSDYLLGPMLDERSEVDTPSNEIGN